MLQSIYQQNREKLVRVGIDSAGLDTRLIFKHVLKVSDMDFMGGVERPVSDKEAAQIESLIDRRLKGEPVSRIIGEREFWGLPFKITEDVLDPRADTETIIEVALHKYKDKPPESVLDLGTGSGCILIALLHEWKETRGVGVDISEQALEIARENAKNNNVADRAAFIQSDWGNSIEESFALIVSNPPYIPGREIESLAKEVRNHDPILALDGGKDGFEEVKKVVMITKALLKTGGICLLEIGFGQSEYVLRLVEESGLSVTDIHPDLAGVLRVVEISCGDK